MAAFDPAAWMAEYEAIGGAVYAIERGERRAIQFKLPRDPAGRGNELSAALQSVPGGDWIVYDWIAETRGAVIAPADAG